MDLNTRKADIINKINAGNLNFGSLEKYIISNDIGLQMLFIKKCEDYAYVSEELYEDIINGKTFLSDEALLSSQKFIRNLALITIEAGRLENIDELLGILIDSEEIISVLKQRLNDPNYICTDIGTYSTIAMKLIIEKNRTDIIQAIDLSRLLDDEEIKKLLMNVINTNPYILSLKNLIYIQKCHKSLVNFDLFEVALDKIKQLEYIDQSVNCDVLLKLCPDNQKENFFELLLSKGHLCINYLLNQDLSQYEEIIKNSIEKGIVYLDIPTIEDSDRSREEFLSMVEKIKNTDMFWHFIENGQLDSLLYANNNLGIHQWRVNSLFSSDEIAKIVEIIKKKPENFQREFDYSVLPKEISAELIKIQDYSIDFLKTSYDSEMFLDSIKEKIRKGHRFGLPEYMLNDEIINLAIECGKIDCLFGYSSNLKTINKEQIVRIIEFLSKSEDSKLAVFEKIKRIIYNSPIFLTFYMKDDIYIEEILSIIHHAEGYEKYYTSEIYNASKHYLASKHNLNLSHMDVLVNNYGYLLIHYIENKSIQRIINMNESDFNKFVSIFPPVDFEMKDAQAIYDSLKQHEFSTKNGEILNIFNRIIIAIEENDNNVFQDFHLLAYEFERLYKKLAKNFPQIQSISDLKEFFICIKDKIKNGNIDEQNLYKDILHTLTNHYITIKREKWRNEFPFENFQNQLPYNLDEKDLDKIKIIICLRHLINKNGIDLEKLCSNIGIDTDTLKLIYGIYIGEVELNSIVISDEKKTEISNLIRKTISITKDYINNNMPNDYLETIDAVIKATKIDSDGTVSIDQIDNDSINRSIYMLACQIISEYPPRKKSYVKADYNLIYFIMSNLQVEIMEEHLLLHDQIVDTLSTIMSKSKLHICPDKLKNLQDLKGELILQDGFDGIAAFITYFYKIYEEEMEKAKVLGTNVVNLSIANILKKAEAYGAKSSIYAQILGKQDARMIKANPGPNSATNNVENRLDDAVEWTEKLFKREEVSIPTFKKDFIISEEKKINVIVGNFKNSCNLTHGERTGSCMRIGGAGETLFKFCIENKNGFHIVFRDTEEQRYISRVSGFRNGNTVFLNQLRSSCIDKYCDDDLIKTIEAVARELISLSAESDMPICNVVIHNSYAMSSSKKESINFNISNNKVGLPYFYSDIGTSGIVLATTSTNSNLVPIDFNMKGVPNYLPARETVTNIDNMEQLKENIGRIYTMKKMFDGIDWRYIEMLDFSTGIKYGFAGEDWYVYIDNDDVLYEEIIDIDKRALDEKELATKLLMEQSSVMEGIYAK